MNKSETLYLNESNWFYPVFAGVLGMLFPWPRDSRLEWNTHFGRRCHLQRKFVAVSVIPGFDFDFRANCSDFATMLDSGGDGRDAEYLDSNPQSLATILRALSMCFVTNTSLFMWKNDQNKSENKINYAKFNEPVSFQNRLSEKVMTHINPIVCVFFFKFYQWNEIRFFRLLVKITR